jgi:hypothetical protein
MIEYLLVFDLQRFEEILQRCLQARQAGNYLRFKVV